MSWWCGLSRDELQREIAVRVEGWRCQRLSLNDFVGENLRQAWEPRAEKKSRRNAV